MNKVKPIYLAPLQGYTNVFYRIALQKVYSGIAKYFTPFFEEGKDQFTDPELFPELDQALNSGCYLVPQIATNNARFLVAFSKKIEELGYGEININMGCPFPMLVKRKKGGGMLTEYDLVRQILNDYYQEDIGLKLSVKVRSGFDDAEQGLKLLEVLNQFPLHEIIIHPRLVTQKYNGQPNWDDFNTMLQASSIPIVANGDIVHSNDLKEMEKRFPTLKAIMIGRGLLTNPGAFLYEGKEAESKFLEFHEVYHDMVLENTIDWNQAYNYLSDFWYYPLASTTEGKRYFRKLKKHNHPNMYKDWLDGVNDFLKLNKDGI